MQLVISPVSLKEVARFYCNYYYYYYLIIIIIMFVMFIMLVMFIVVSVEKRSISEDLCQHFVGTSKSLKVWETLFTLQFYSSCNWLGACRYFLPIKSLHFKVFGNFLNLRAAKSVCKCANVYLKQFNNEKRAWNMFISNCKNAVAKLNLQSGEIWNSSDTNHT